MRRLFFFLIFLAAWLAGCALLPFPPTTPTPEPIRFPTPTPSPYDLASLINDLRAAGADVVRGETSSPDIFSVPIHHIIVNGATVNVREYADATTAEVEAAWVTPEGGEIISPDPNDSNLMVVVHIDWEATPHFFRRDRLIVAYVGDSLSILRALETVLGPQFAGGPLPELGALPTTYRHTWSLPAPQPAEPGDIQLPTVWLGADGENAVLATTSAFSYSDKVTGMGVIADPAQPQFLGEALATASLGADRSGVVIISAEYGTIQSFEAFIQPWTDDAEDFALFAGQTIKGEVKHEGDIFTFTLEPLGKTEDSLLVASISFDNPKASGSAVYIWRLNPGGKPASTETGTSLAEEGQPEEIILILEPGPGSRLTSPVHVAGFTGRVFEQTLVVRVLLDDGTEIARVPAIIAADIGQRGRFEVEVPFTIIGERQAFIQVYAESPRDGGVTHLSSVGLTIADSGPEIFVPIEPYPERIVIFKPSLNDTISGGVVYVEGFALASFEQTLVVEVLDQAGKVIGSQPVTVTAPDIGMPGPFSVGIPYSITSSGPGRIVVRDPSAVFEGDVHISSVEVRLSP